MRHQVRKKRFSRTSSHRIAMFRNMVTSLIQEGRITTTLSKAKALRSVAEKMVTLAKRGDLHARRQAASYVRTAEAVRRLFAELGPRFKQRAGGYTRILKLGFRHGDGAPMAIIEYLGYEPKLKATTDKSDAKKEKKAKAEKPKQEEAQAETKAEKKPEKKAKAEKKPAAKKEKTEKEKNPKKKK